MQNKLFTTTKQTQKRKTSLNNQQLTFNSLVTIRRYLYGERFFFPES